MNTKISKQGIALLIAISISALPIYALGIASDYLPGNTLELKPGEVKEYGIRLQNPDEETKAKLTIHSDNNIAEIIGYKDIYTLPKGSTPIKIRVKAPANAKPNSFYTVGVSLEASSSDAGIVAFASKISKDFKVKIAGEAAAEIPQRGLRVSQKLSMPLQDGKKGNNLAYIIIGLLILGIIIYLLRRKKPF